MVSQRIEVRIVLRPVAASRAQFRQSSLQQIESDFNVTELRVGACRVVLSIGIVGIDSYCPGKPFARAVDFPQADEDSRAQLSRPRVFRMRCQFTLGELNAAPRGLFALLFTSQR